MLYFYPSLTKWQRLVHLADILSLRAPCDCIVMTNDGTRGDEVLRYFGITEHKIRFWLNGVDKEIYRPDFDKASFRQKWNIPSEDRIVLTVSRLANWKRVDRLLQAVPQVVNEMEKVKFLIVGDGPERHNLELMVAGLSISKYVKFTGFLNQQEVCECMNAADLFVSFYDVSNLCNPVLEAMACGKCVVSLDDDSLEEIIRDGENGILVKPSSVEEDLPGILVGLLEDDQKRLHLGKKAQEFALRNFDTWDERVEKEIRLIEEVACRRLAT